MYILHEAPANGAFLVVFIAVIVYIDVTRKHIKSI